MLGAIIGDIAGSKYEFNNTFDYDFEMFGEGCDFTDDTICTVAIADAILNGRSYQESLLDWCRRYPSPKGAYGGRFAGWIRSLDPQPYNSFGNGSAMRVSPVAWLFDDLSQVLEEAEKTALPTHNHPEGIKGAKAVAHAIWHFRKSKESHLPDDEAMKAFKDIARSYYDDSVAWLFDDLSQVLEEAEKTALPTHNHPEGIKGAKAVAHAIWHFRKSKESHLPDDEAMKAFKDIARSYYDDFEARDYPKGKFDETCMDAVPLSFYLLSQASSFEDAIRLAISHGGDSDTIGAIVGSIAEARFGIPQDMKEKAISYLPDDMREISARIKCRH